MKKGLIILLLTILAIGFSLAQTPAGTASPSTSVTGTTTYRDAAGHIIGTSNTSVTGTTTYRNAAGRVTETPYQNPNGTIPKK